MPDNELIYNALTKDIVYLNQTMDSKYPMMAYTVCENGKPNMTVMLWSLPFERMTIDESNRLIVLCKLIRKAVKRAEEHLELLKYEFFSKDGKVLKASAFEELIVTYREAKKKNLTDFTLLKVTSQISENTLSDILKSLNSFCFVGYGKDESLNILLTGTNKDECNLLIEKLGENKIETLVNGEKKL